jgi:transcriptional regulator GlxA family with amidase domain
MNFGFLIFDDAEELDWVGPWEVITAWGRLPGGPQHCFTVSEAGGTVRCAKGLRVVADYSFADCPPLDYLLIPGGQGTRREAHNEVLLGFVKTQGARCRQVISVCTGSFVLHAAGLLAGKPATTYWGSLNRLREAGVRVEEKRWVRTGNVWTAAGVSAGIDAALALVAAEAGAEIAGEVQFYIEYYPEGIRYGQAHTRPDAPAYLREKVGSGGVGSGE